MYFNTEPKWQKDLIRELAEKYGIDIRIVRTMVYYPYLFSKNVMQDPHDNRAIRHRYLGAFDIKKYELKADKELDDE